MRQLSLAPNSNGILRAPQPWMRLLLCVEPRLRIHFQRSPSSRCRPLAMSGFCLWPQVGIHALLCRIADRQPTHTPTPSTDPTVNHRSECCRHGSHHCSHHMDMAVVMLHMHNASMEATKIQLAYSKNSKRRVEDIGIGYANNASPRHEPDKDVLLHLQEKQIHDLVAWHIQVLDAKWYVKPGPHLGSRNTCSTSTLWTCSTTS